MPSIVDLKYLYCDNNEAITKEKEPLSNTKSKQVLKKYQLIREIIDITDVIVDKVPTNQNIVDPLTKPLPQKKYDSHVLAYGMRNKGDWL